MAAPSTHTLLSKGRELLAQGRAAAAVGLLEQAAAREPDAPSVHEALGRAYGACRRHSEARAAFEAVLDRDPTDAYAHRSAARCAEAEGDLPAAVRHLRLAVALDPSLEHHDDLARVQARAVLSNRDEDSS